jgi:anthranilate synthase component 1
VNYPGKEKFVELSNNFNRIVVYHELNITEPGHLLLLKAMEEEGELVFFESLGENADDSRFSFLGLNPKHVYEFQNGNLFCDGNQVNDVNDDNVFDYLKGITDEYKTPVDDTHGHFSGGLSGYFGYEMVNYCGILRKKIRESESIPQFLLMHIDDFICHDNQKKVYYLATSVYPKGNPEQAYDEALKYLLQLEDDVIRRVSTTTLPYVPARADAIEPEFSDSKESFMQKVQNTVDMIDSGEALQTVLSMRAFVPRDLDPYRFYIRLRKLNPSPYMFYIKTKKMTVAGSSPEVHVRCSGKGALLRPIAGTAKRTGDEKKDAEARRTLLADEKERAEHLMLVDLARNDLSRIAKPESVKVTRFMKPENYSHVMHLVSDVVAELDDEKNMIDVLRESFPAGTVSGAPKVRAIEIIDESEVHPRGIYAGAVGYIGFNGMMDTCITIRTAYFTPEGNYIQAGAGIVQDSVPEKEYEEIQNKLRALSVSLPFAKI